LGSGLLLSTEIKKVITSSLYTKLHCIVTGNFTCSEKGRRNNPYKKRKRLDFKTVETHIVSWPEDGLISKV